MTGSAATALVVYFCNCQITERNSLHKQITTKRQIVARIHVAAVPIVTAGKT
jgi:hypothetical protein